MRSVIGSRKTSCLTNLFLEYWDARRTQLGLGARKSYKKEINSNRKEYLMAIKTDGKTSYKPVLGLSTDRYVK